MKIVSVESLAIPEVKTVTFQRFKDNRGFFTEPYRRSDFSSLHFFPNDTIFQINESFSQTHVVRGLHFQWNPYMGKLVRTIQGHMIDLVLDIRKNSPTAGNIIALDMPGNADRETDTWIWVPAGFAHGNFFLEPTTIVYLCSGEYSQGCEAGISPLAPDIDWSLCDSPLKQQFDSTLHQGIMSDKDRAGVTLAEWWNDERSAHFIYDPAHGIKGLA